MKIDDILRKLSSDPAVFGHVQSELSKAADPRARFVELAREQGLAVDSGELEQALRSYGRELEEHELNEVSGGFNPQPDPPGRVAYSYSALIGLLLPAV